MGTGLHATTGPTVILYDPEEDWEGPYTTKATMTMTKPASHQVAYGLFVGGQDLDTDKQRYTYFVIRQDGKYLIRKRTGRDDGERRRRLDGSRGDSEAQCAGQPDQ